MRGLAAGLRRRRCASFACRRPAAGSAGARSMTASPARSNVSQSGRACCPLPVSQPRGTTSRQRATCQVRTARALPQVCMPPSPAAEWPRPTHRPATTPSLAYLPARMRMSSEGCAQNVEACACWTKLTVSRPEFSADAPASRRPLEVRCFGGEASIGSSILLCAGSARIPVSGRPPKTLAIFWWLHRATLRCLFPLRIHWILRCEHEQTSPPPAKFAGLACLQEDEHRPNRIDVRLILAGPLPMHCENRPMPYFRLYGQGATASLAVWRL